MPVFGRMPGKRCGSAFGCDQELLPGKLLLHMRKAPAVRTEFLSAKEMEMKKHLLVRRMRITGRLPLSKMPH